jgi:hypothetical protein
MARSSRATTIRDGQCIGPEISTDATVVATSNTIASNSGINWLTPWVCFGAVRSTVVGIVIVVMDALSSLRTK